MGFFIALIYIVLTHLTPEFVISSMAVDKLMPVLLLIGLFCAIPTMTTTGASFRTPQVYLGFAFVIAGMMSQIMQGWLGGGLFVFETLGLVFGVFLLVVTTTVSYARLRILATIVIAVGMIYSITGHLAVHYGYGGSQFLVGANLSDDPSEDGGVVRMRGSGFLNDPNDLGQYFVICIALLSINWKTKSIIRNVLFVFDSSEKSVGELRLGQLAKRVIQGQFSDPEGPEPVRFPHCDFCLIVQALDYTAGKLFAGAKIVEDEIAVGT
jgi:hypothetical protein